MAALNRRVKKKETGLEDGITNDLTEPPRENRLKKKNEQSLRDTLDYNKRPNVHVFRVLEERKKGWAGKKKKKRGK